MISRRIYLSGTLFEIFKINYKEIFKIIKKPFLLFVNINNNFLR